MTKIGMPRLSDSMETGTIIRWLKQNGDTVERGDPIAEVETDKATMEFEAPAAGTLRILVGEGATVDVGAPIATIGDPAGTEAPPARAGASRAVPRQTGAAAAGRSRPKASPIAVRLAADLGVDLTDLVGSGPGGRLVKADVRAAAEDRAAGASAAAPGEDSGAGAPTAPPEQDRVVVPEPVTAPPARATAPSRELEPKGKVTARGQAVSVELSRVQSVVALRMSSAKATVPDFVLEAEVNMMAVLELRSQLAAAVERPPSINDFIVRAAAVTLRHHPRVNASFTPNGLLLWNRVNIGVAVAADDSLLVPTIFDADRLPLSEIAVESRRLATAARDGELLPRDMEGGTFTISNLGMFGVDRFVGIINEPQAALLCVGRLVDRPAIDAGEVVGRPMISLSLVSDHRVLYGADAAQFLKDLAITLENPLAALI